MSSQYQSSSFENILSVQVGTTTSKLSLFFFFFFILVMFDSRNVSLLLFQCLPGKKVIHQTNCK